MFNRFDKFGAAENLPINHLTHADHQKCFFLSLYFEQSSWLLEHEYFLFNFSLLWLLQNISQYDKLPPSRKH